MTLKNLIYAGAAFLLLLACTENKKEANESKNRTLDSGGDILTMAGDEPTSAEAILLEDDRITFVAGLEEARKRNKGVKVTLETGRVPI